MKRNRIWMTIVFILGVICIGYFIMYITMVGMNNTFTWFWLLAGGVLIGGDILWYLLDRQGQPSAGVGAPYSACGNRCGHSCVCSR